MQLFNKNLPKPFSFRRETFIATFCSFVKNKNRKKKKRTRRSTCVDNNYFESRETKRVPINKSRCS